MVLLVLGACGDDVTTQSTPAPDATWVGTTECASCHVDEAQAWSGSHHDLAMQDATDETVLGDFGEAAFTNFGDFTTFSRRGDAFVIQTEGPDGDVADFEVAYVFGVDPLQQYLIELDGGRLQAFTVAWDTRPAEEGGQRWFHLYPDEQISAGDRLHWTGPSMNWNYMCAECHTTALQRNFELATLTYETTWSEMDVSCESCHGPGSQHLALVESGVTPSSPIGLGLNPGLTDRTGGGWVIEDGEAIAHRTVSLAGSGQVETCAHCHSRRATLEQVRDPATSIHNSDMVSRLEPGLYHADGQVLEEVYVYGSFVQSKMYNAGVRCSDCHDPHSLELNAPGNALCASCHSVEVFDTPDHYFHEEGSSGAQCVECHMPETTYMLVDPRRDHSMRVPRPALAEEIDAPDACTMCHTDQSSGWAADVVENWYGPRDEKAEFAARAIHASREGRPGSGVALVEVASDLALSGIVRATALSMSSNQPSSQTLATVEAGTNDPDPAVRLGALAALDGVSPEARVPIAFRLLRDSIRSVRIEAARVLAPVPLTTLTGSQRALLGEVFQEYIDAQLVNADRAEAHTNIGNLYAQRGIADAAEIAYRDAIRVDASFALAYLNLADIYRALGREAEGEATLRDGLARALETPALHHALGLLLVRRGETNLAMEQLRRAVELAPDDPRMAYVLGVGLNSGGDWPAARKTIDSALASSPWDRDLLTLMATALRDQSETEEALQYAVRLAEVAPEDPGILQLLAELRRELAGR